MFLLVENSEGQFSGLVEDQDCGLSIFADRDLRITQSIAGAIGLDLVDDFLELQGQIFGKDAGFLPGEDLVEVLVLGERAVSIVGTARRDGEAGIEIVDKVGEVGMALLESGKGGAGAFL